MKNNTRFWGVFILLVLVFLMMVACFVVPPKDAHAGVDTLAVVGKSGLSVGSYVVYDQYTGVMYFYTNNGIILPLYNADGTFRVYSGWQGQ